MTAEYQNFRTDAFFSSICGKPLGKGGSETRYKCPKANGKNRDLYVSSSGQWHCKHANCAAESGCQVTKGGPRQFLSLVNPDLKDRDAFEKLNQYGRNDTSPSKQQIKAPKKPPTIWKTLDVMRSNMPKWDSIIEKVGKPPKVKDSFFYHFSDGKEAFVVIRTDGPNGKTYTQAIPVSGGWQAGSLKSNRPLYRLTDLPKDTTTPVIVVEGEKCAILLQKTINENGFRAWVTTPSQGSESPQKSDWSPMKGKSVVILPDNDEAGHKFAEKVAEFSYQSGATSVKIAESFYGKEKNDARDVADFITEGGNVKEIREAIHKARKIPGQTNSKQALSQDIPNIRITFGLGTISEMAHKGILALLNGNAGIFHRSGDLVMIQADEKIKLPGIRWPSGEPRIVPVSSSILRNKLDQTAIWQRFDMRTKEWITTRPANEAVDTIMGNKEWPLLPYLSMIFETPTMRLDGSFLNSPGWDESTGIFFMPRPGEHWHIPTNPTSAQIKAAKEALLEVHCDFPFEKECHQAAAIAGILTLLSGLTYLNRPLFMWDANVRGAGKTLGADVCSLIATGRDFPKMTQGVDESEDRKRITTLAMSGARAVLVDNIVGKFGNAAIDSAITSEGSWEDRLLGLNKTWRGTLLLTWFATGNNIEVQGDLSRRVIPVKIMSEEERPEHRTGYKHSDLRSWVKAERVRLATAGLTILRGYQVAGKPDQKLINFGSFEEWSSTVRNAIVWAGFADPYEGNEDIQQKADSDAVAIGALLQAWYETFREMPVSMAKIAKMEPIEEPENQAEIERNASLTALKECLSAVAGNDKGDGWNARKAGQILKRFEKRVFKGLRFEQCSETNMGATWKARRILFS